MQKQCAEIMGELLAPHVRQVQADLEIWLVEPGVPDSLAEAMRYCVLGGGKRLRPALAFLSFEAVRECQAPAEPVQPSEALRRAAVAVELVHCFSLVHDDLPALDNDDLRRGRPTGHVRFGEAMAILAGDALLTRAMGLLAECDDPVSSRLVAELARAGGAAGMIAGQVADMGLCGVDEGPEGLRQIHLHKTAAVIRAAARMGALCASATREHLQAVCEYAELLGLAFQLIDDMLDVTGDAATLGKTPGKDAVGAKRTHVSLLGLAGAADLAGELTSRAQSALEPLGRGGQKLRRLAEMLAERTH